METISDDSDLQLQRASADLIEDLSRSSKTTFWKLDRNGTTYLRKNIRIHEVHRLINLLEPFQENPQLLDPHLQNILSLLTDAFLRDLDRKTVLPEATSVALYMPLARAVCKLLYTFCKIRGDKIVVRFFPTETRYLEPLLSALETSDIPSREQASNQWSWEERYITLLWLAHLQLLPFDLASISSNTNLTVPNIKNLVWPANIPGAATRAISLAIQYLELAGKERDAAKVLLVRISIRHDMQKLGLLHALVDWALLSLQSCDDIALLYYQIGILSYLAGLLTSSTSTSDMDPYLNRIYSGIITLSRTDSPGRSSIVSSSVIARKNIIKILRAITVLELRSDTTSGNADTASIVEETIQHLLEALADNDTPVRIAASKALSVITLRLAPLLVEQVVEAIIDSLNFNVLWTYRQYDKRRVRIRDLSAVDPLQWHGLILTLSQLLYRRAPPSNTLSSILHALLVGLSFEVRATSGSSLGSNVRDAACFGIWALARRYTTAELQVISRPTIIIAEHHDATSSILQVLAAELVVAASLDPAGNIRRAASAALQELVGRHPDTVVNGIANVQIVDYHKVALRSKALQVGGAAALLSKHNSTALLDGLLSWRGIGDSVAVTRRQIAHCFASILQNSCDSSNHVGMLSHIQGLISQTEQREVHQRHGLLLCIAEIISVSAQKQFGNDHENFLISGVDKAGVKQEIAPTVLDFAVDILTSANIATANTPSLIIEAVCEVISSSCHLCLYVYNGLDHAPNEVRARLVEVSQKLVRKWLCVSEKDVLVAVTRAAFALAQLITASELESLLTDWISMIPSSVVGKPAIHSGPLLATCLSYSLAEPHQQDTIVTYVAQSWKPNLDIDSRVMLLEALAHGDILQQNIFAFQNMITEGLDDYTTDTRGDIGSWVRSQAIKAASLCFMTKSSFNDNQCNVDAIRDKVIRLAAEKFDKVRPEAAHALTQYFIYRSQQRTLSENGTCYDLANASSLEYFRHLISESMRLPNAYKLPLQNLLTGLVSSAAAGSETLIRVTRQALVEFCRQQDNKMIEPVISTLLNMLKENLSVDRVVVPTLETIGYLFDEGIVQHSQISFMALFTQTQKAHFKSSNVRKLEAAIRIYGGLLDHFDDGSQEQKKVLVKLVSLLLHPILLIRNAVVDLLWIWRGYGAGVDWAKVKKGADELEILKRDLGIL